MGPSPAHGVSKDDDDGEELGPPPLSHGIGHGMLKG